MILHIAEYQFKDATAQAQGATYLAEVYLPAKKLQAGFISAYIVANGPLGILALLRFETKEHMRAASAEREGFKAFMALLANRPDIVIRPNLTTGELQAQPTP